MKSASIIRLAAVIAALHVAVLSYAFGPRHPGYILVTCVWGVTVWGGVLLVNQAKRRGATIAGVVLLLALQQVIHQVWRAEVPGFWWPLAQFAALQCLIGFGLCRAAP